MKRPILLALATLTLSFMLSSCMTSYHWSIGQTSNEFFAQNKKIENKLELVKQSAEWTVYKLYVPDQQPYFFYFRDNKLNQVDRGTRSPDVIIQNNSN
jgi:hypothetical protein